MRSTQILVLGGYGHFGGRICRNLARDRNIQVIVGGRSYARAEAYCRSLADAPRPPFPLEIDLEGKGWQNLLTQCQCDLVIHTCGPFQGQDYAVAAACARSGIHYIDLADSRDFVCGIGQLDALAIRNECLVVSGASSVPALSAAVIDRLAMGVEPSAIQIVIAPGQKTPRGLATLRSVMSYCGRPFTILNNRVQRTVFGWQGLSRIQFYFLPGRLSARCDVPDLTLWPTTYPSLESVEFRAALELGIGHLGFWFLAAIHRIGLVRDPASWAPIVQKLADRLDVFGSNEGGMQIRLRGRTGDGETVTRFWELFAGDGHGPEIPTIPAIVIARRLARNLETRKGAMTAAGLITLEEFDRETSGLNLHWEYFGDIE